MAGTHKKLLVANWKMHNNVQQASHFIVRLEKYLKHIPREAEVVICPSFVSLQPLKMQLHSSPIKLGAQTIHHSDEGTYTGEVSGLMLKGITDYVIVGHSERRANNHETDAIIAKKVAAAIRHMMVPILCVGENLVERKEGETNMVVHNQVVTGLSHITPEEVEQGLVVTYEPVWAISSGDGRGMDAKPADIKQGAAAIRHNISELFGKRAATQTRVLYGGSVNPSNARDILQVDGIDGLLIGGASLNYQQFGDIIMSVKGL